MCHWDYLTGSCSLLHNIYLKLKTYHEVLDPVAELINKQQR